MATLSFDPHSVRSSVRAAAQDNFFRGLVSSKLGSDRILDDELIDLIVSNPLLDDIFDDLCNTTAGWARIQKAIGASFSNLEYRESVEISDDESQNAACRQVWMAAVDDPRFNLVLKQAQDEAKLPPPMVRGSGLSGVLGILEKIRAALTSGASKHSDATLAGSVLAAVLAGVLGAKVVLVANDAPKPSDPSTALSALTSAVNSLNSNASAQTTALLTMNDNILQQTNALNRLPKKYGTVIYNNLPEQRVQDLWLGIGALEGSVAYLKKDVKQITTALDSTDRKVTAIEGQINFANEVKKSLDQIANGIGPAETETSDHKQEGLPSLRKSSKDIADSLWMPPRVATTGVASSSTLNAAAAQAPAVTPAPAPSAPANPVSVAASLQTLAGIARTEDKAYLRDFQAEYRVSATESVASLERSDGTPCTLWWNLTALTADSATVSIVDDNCGTGLKSLKIGKDAMPVQKTNFKARFDRSERGLPWFRKAAVLALSRDQ